jgi:coatomer subunit beta
MDGRTTIKQDGMLMTVIRFILPQKEKRLKKLLLFYYEVCPKFNENGQLREEVILMTNAIQNDLKHPNEFIRGSTLRFLTKLPEAELLEPLVPAARACLEHRHSFVRKNAVFAIMQIYKQHEHLIPDAPEVIQTFLAAESDSTCKRNAFTMLIQTAPERAYEYFVQHVYDSVAGQDELMQLAVIELVRKEGVRSEGPVRVGFSQYIYIL